MMAVNFNDTIFSSSGNAISLPSVFYFPETTQRTQMEDTKDRERTSGDVLPEEQGSVRMGRRFDREFHSTCQTKRNIKSISIYTREKDIDGGQF